MSLHTNIVIAYSLRSVFVSIEISAYNEEMKFEYSSYTAASELFNIPTWAFMTNSN